MDNTKVIRLHKSTIDRVAEEADKNRRSVAVQFDVILEEWLAWKGLGSSSVAAQADSDGGDR